jgi:TRAP-type uncharacterized transport system fused permease subunit
VLPFVFVYAPAVLLIEGGLVRQWSTFFAAVLGLVAMNFAITGYVTSPLSVSKRVMMGLGALLILQFKLTFFILGVAILVTVFVLQHLNNAHPSPP